MKLGRGAGNAAILITVCIFGAALLLSMAMGVMVYRQVQSRTDSSGERRLGLTYITAKIHSHDASSVYTGSFGGKDAVFLPEDSPEGDGGYVTILYVHEGYLMELYCAQGAVLSPKDGQRLTEAEGLEVRLESDLLFLTYTDSRGRRETAEVYLRSGAADTYRYDISAGAGNV